jgi:hypothetical protein
MAAGIRCADHVTPSIRKSWRPLGRYSSLADYKPRRNDSMYDLGLSQRWLVWDITRVVRWKLTDASEEHVTSVFRVEEWDRQETSKNPVASSAFSRLQGVTSQKIEPFLIILVGLDTIGIVEVWRLRWLGYLIHHHHHHHHWQNRPFEP